MFHPVEEGEERVVSVEVTPTMTRDEVCTLILDACDTFY